MTIFHAIHYLPRTGYSWHEFVRGFTREEITERVNAFWIQEKVETVSMCTSLLSEHGVSAEVAGKFAITLVERLSCIRDTIADGIPRYHNCSEKVKQLISDTVAKMIPDEHRLKAAEVLKSQSKILVNYALDFMRVCIEPIKMKIGGEVMQYTVPEYIDYCRTVYKSCNDDTIFIVHSSVFIPDLSSISSSNLPRILQSIFKGFLLEKVSLFRNDKLLRHTSEVNYIVKAIKVLVHKMFDKTGIELSGQTAEQIRVKVLNNINHDQGLKNFCAIDTVLGKMVKFLSNSNMTI